MPRFQSVVQAGARIVPRGWSYVMQAAARVYPPFRDYEIDTENGKLLVDLRYRMCSPYVLYGGLPHELGMARLMRHVVRPGDICVDVGASIGYYTRLLSTLVGPAGSVIAYEPVPEALDVLRRNTARLANVRIIDAALSDRDGQADFFVASTEDMSSLAASAGRVRLSVRLETLDALLGHVPRVDFVKIDVEGFELKVIQGGAQLLQRFQPLITFELTRRYIDQFGHDMDDFRAVLEPLGYTLHWLQHTGEGRLLLGTNRSNDAVAVPCGRMYDL